jgi:hypothetical protein
MNLKVLTCNCDKGYSPELQEFLARTFAEKRYDFILLQEIRARKLPPFDPLMTDILGEYQLLRAFNKDMGMWSELMLAYRKSFSLEESKFLAFPPFKKFNHLLPEFGFLLGTFVTPEGKVRVGSVHCQSSFQPITRGREAKLIKEALLTDNIADLPTIF